MAANPTSVKKLVLKHCFNPLNVSHRTSYTLILKPVLHGTLKDKKKLCSMYENCCTFARKYWKWSRCLPSLRISHTHTKRTIYRSFKIDQTHVGSSLNNILEPLEQSSLSTMNLSQVKYPKERFNKIKGAMKRKCPF
jgi:hypothetical protein